MKSNCEVEISIRLFHMDNKMGFWRVNTNDNPSSLTSFFRPFRLPSSSAGAVWTTAIKEQLQSLRYLVFELSFSQGDCSAVYQLLYQIQMRNWWNQSILHSVIWNDDVLTIFIFCSNCLIDNQLLIITYVFKKYFESEKRKLWIFNSVSVESMHITVNSKLPMRMITENEKSMQNEEVLLLYQKQLSI